MILKKLEKNDLITILSPAKSIGKEEIVFAHKFWESQGFRVKLANNVTTQNYYFAGKAAERAKDFESALLDAETKAIICARGGYGCVQLFDYLDANLFSKYPKWIIGFSDVTVFHFHQNKLQIPSIHATMPLNYKENSIDSLSYLIDFLKTQGFSYSWRSETFRSGKVRGEIIGGNLSVMSDLIGTQLMPDFEGKILFIEEVGEHLYVIDRMFYQLKFAGILDQLSGIIIGDFSDIQDTEPKFGKPLKELILKHVKPLQIPFAFDFPAGHCQHNIPIVFGVEKELEILENGTIELKT